MILRANIVANTSNAAVIVDSVSGIVREDIFVSNITLRDRNVRVLRTFSNGVVELSQNVSITSGNVVQFQKLVSNVGLIASESRSAFFLRDRPSYDPSADPRLPKLTSLAANLLPNDQSIVLNGNTSALGITSIHLPKTATVDRYSANVQFNSVSGVQVGDFLLGASFDANSVKNTYNLTTSARVIWVGNANTYIGFNKPIVVSSGRTYLFRSPVQPFVRVGAETIYYANISSTGNTVTLTDITRNIANSRPVNQTVTTLSNTANGFVLRVTDATGVQVLDYVLLNNTTRTSNVRVIWTPTGEANANIGINSSITADAGSTVAFDRDLIWPANTTVSILGSIPL